MTTITYFVKNNGATCKVFKVLELHSFRLNITERSHGKYADCKNITLISVGTPSTIARLLHGIPFTLSLKVVHPYTVSSTIESSTS